ncbi:MAG: ATP-binding protein [Tannerella sp.]|nr:ATP-binding protein [Tannerella sp.]
MDKKLLKIGDSIFDSQIAGDYYYVDKSLLIKNLFDRPAEVTLITRPRRFGKTLNMYMLKSFFEYNCELRKDNASKRHLFKDLKIEQAGERYLKHFGQYPVIFLSFKEAKASKWEQSYNAIKECFYAEYERHINIAGSERLTEAKKIRFRRFLDRAALDSDFPSAIKFLSDCLDDHYGKPVVILIDEYDVPLDAAHNGGFYDAMLDLIRSMFSSSLKDNGSLAFAVMTGCLRISQESIFTGLNNPVMASIASYDYSEYFGFTQEEVDEMLKYYGLEGKREEIREWYDGYLFGDVTVYNPWSVIKRVTDLLVKYDRAPELYWANTSGNDIIRKLVDRVANDDAKYELETLMAGGTIEKPINENITYNDIDKGSIDNLWNFLFFTGYLKKVGENFEGEQRKFVLSIPNKEVFHIYRTQISQWFNKTLENNNIPREFIQALIAGDKETAQKRLSAMLMKSISYFDAAESYYHGFLTALFTNVKGYEVKSNRETGDGRCDIFMRPYSRELPVILIEAKIAPTYSSMAAKCKEALQQIEDNRYADEFIEDGFSNILKYGIAFYKKECLVEFRV